MKRLFLLAFFLVATLASASAQTLSPLGLWQTEEKATVEVYKCGDKICAKLTQLPGGKNKSPETGKPFTDDKNPDEALQSRPLQGLVIMQGLTLTEKNKWENGSIYDPGSGRTYSCYLQLINEKTAEMKGYIGTPLLGRATTWTRLK